MNTDKKHIQHLAAICREKGVEYAVISPGSRCAPLIVAFNRMKGINCISIIDERSAGFVALGIAQQTNKTVVLICTSGSAVLNYAPALAEAYYQKIPLLVLSADRPNEWIDQGENQSINQFEVYKNYIKKSYQLPLQFHTDKDLWYSDRIISEALNTCNYPDFGPVHINIPLREPLYNLEEEDLSQMKVIEFEKPQYTLDAEKFNTLGDFWKKQDKILVVVGGLSKRSKALNEVLQSINNQDNIVILKESISNIYGDDFIDQIDANIELIEHYQLDEFKPKLVLTFGAGVVSKKLKFWLRKQENLEHWHITKSFEHWDIFQALSKVIQIDPLSFLTKMQAYTCVQASTYKSAWLALNKKTQKGLANYLQEIEFTDFNLFAYFLTALPKQSMVQLGNSTPVRYANLLHIEGEQQLSFNANRGVSGIDGVLSTAAGASLVNTNKLCICITGDVATLYDSNALMNQHVQANFKLVIINNSGGNIFKIIPGPNKLEELEQFFETKHPYKFDALAKMYGYKYFQVSKNQDLACTFQAFLAEDQQAAILEINTDGTKSAASLKNYFTYLKEHIKLR